MENIHILNGTKEVWDSITKLGDFVCVLKDGKLLDEYDFKTSSDIDAIQWLMLNFNNAGVRQATCDNETINVVSNNGDIWEYKRSKRQYLSQEEAVDIIKDFQKKYNTLKIEDYIVSCKGNKTLSIGNILPDAAFSEISDIFNKHRCKMYDFIVWDNEIDFMIGWEETGEAHYKRVIGQTSPKDVRAYNKVIQSNKFKEHMKVHQDDFIIPFENIISYTDSNGYFDNLTTNFVEIVVEFPFNIGYSGLCTISSSENVVYAKRKNRELYSKFTLDGRKTLINKCVFVLKRNRDNPNEFYLITMFPGEYAIKEPSDRNIRSEEENRTVIDFWNKHALVFNPKDIDLETATYTCPYDIGA